MRPPFTSISAIVPVFVAHGELALGALGHVVDFAGGKIGDVGFRAATKAVAFLRLLLVDRSA